MPRREENYFRYFATSPDMETWGVTVTAAGFTRVRAGSPYPPFPHPGDHQFDWARGRVLDALQVVLITNGSGRFETRATGSREIHAGMAFALLPGVWHRYRPDERTGWEESWLEVRGPLVDNLIKKGIFRAAEAVRTGALGAGMESALEQVHARSRNGPPGFDAARAAAAYAVLAAWERAGREDGRPVPRLARAVGEAERFLAEHHAEPVEVRELAARLGVAYSHFRRAFKQHTGFAPWQYVLHLRLARARRLLASSDATLDDIAAQLGFNSGFHLSTMFKSAHGMSPQAWRQSLAGPVLKKNHAR
ncbi:MAG: AraC family transcriptional regulator [Opitutaceae bacterium]|jgi:AraC-like DNA-binding protein|nr:AraC family transcriptional regulator [Opitutaceae bacterium]